ncbi:hypothetical protein PROFUN_16029 [Planoprotostelium fungivorum]|uniref:CCR4-NOT transcription complex subunit 10 n=1 Tax=Planoprotostelium fungivorum TaxID=1890364 RepID=A0A2P6MTE8_9EUKA|nr:hypothetical protein PROFUN_16029 [Planoprotostelium fungivorum]
MSSSEVESALIAFQARDYDECLSCLDRLSHSKDSKVESNRWLVEYLRDGQVNTKDYILQLRSIETEPSEEAKQINKYNEALLLFQVSDVSGAEKIIQPLYTSSTTRKACDRWSFSVGLLYGDILIRSRDEQAMQIFKEMEDRFSVLLGSDSNLALNFHALKGHAHLQLGEYEDAQEEYQKMEKRSDRGNDIRMASLGARIETQKKQYDLALEHLSKCEGKDKERGIFCHNMGCIHHSMGKHHTSLWYLTQSIQNETEESNKGEKEANMKENRRGEVIVSVGYQLLMTGKYEKAFTCLMEGLRYNLRSSRLWLRLAECISLHHHTKYVQSKEAASYKRVRESDEKVILLGTTETSAGEPMSLAFASKCVCNSIYLSDTFAKEGRDAVITKGVLRASLLLSGYIHLCSHQPNLSLEHCKRLLSISNDPQERCLAAIYAAESLCLLNRPNEAIQVLKESSVEKMKEDIRTNTREIESQYLYSLAMASSHLVKRRMYRRRYPSGTERMPLCCPPISVSSEAIKRERESN